MSVDVGALLALGMAAWFVVATVVGLVISRVIRRRDRPIPHNGRGR